MEERKISKLRAAGVEERRNEEKIEQLDSPGLEPSVEKRSTCDYKRNLQDSREARRTIAVQFIKLS